MHSVLVSGSVAYDHIMDFPGEFKDNFLPDKLHNINISFYIPGHQEHFGGTAGNIAYNLALLGEKATIVSTAGNDFARYRTHLEKMGVDLSLLQTGEDLPSAFAYILTDKKDNQISAFYPGANAKAYVSELPHARLAIMAPGNLGDMHAFPALHKKQGTPYFFDPGQVTPALPIEDLKSGIENSEVVFANDYEFSLICTRTGWDATEMLEHGKTFIITLGADGTRVLNASGGFRVPAIPDVSVVDPTGAGDAYRAGYAKGYLLGLSTEQCVQLGSCAAAYTVEAVGTQTHTYTLAEFRSRFSEAYKENCPM
jgi:adenosine kinase